MQWPLRGQDASFFTDMGGQRQGKLRHFCELSRFCREIRLFQYGFRAKNAGNCAPDTGNFADFGYNINLGKNPISDPLSRRGGLPFGPVRRLFPAKGLSSGAFPGLCFAAENAPLSFGTALCSAGGTGAALIRRRPVIDVFLYIEVLFDVPKLKSRH